ncbi:MAG: 30S ribosomal protein S6 [Solirubrobacterales bacterium]|nr:MAG: 30S ribosomal protein S6 [Solirubrobacterales bacterium]
MAAASGTVSMPREPLIYDLVLLLSTSAPEERRASILADAQTAIAGGGGVVERKDQWGTRPLTYRIDHEADAEYHLLQFSGPTSLLDTLSHSLRIADGVLRFRIIKVLSGTPPPPDSAPPVMAAATARAAPAASTTPAPAATPAPAPPVSTAPVSTAPAPAEGTAPAPAGAGTEAGPAV